MMLAPPESNCSFVFAGGICVASMRFVVIGPLHRQPSQAVPATSSVGARTAKQRNPLLFELSILPISQSLGGLLSVSWHPLLLRTCLLFSPGTVLWRDGQDVQPSRRPVVLRFRATPAGYPNSPNLSYRLAWRGDVGMSQMSLSATGVRLSHWGWTKRGTSNRRSK